MVESAEAMTEARWLAVVGAGAGAGLAASAALALPWYVAQGAAPGAVGALGYVGAAGVVAAGGFAAGRPAVSGVTNGALAGVLAGCLAYACIGGPHLALDAAAPFWDVAESRPGEAAGTQALADAVIRVVWRQWTGALTLCGLGGALGGLGGVVAGATRARTPSPGDAGPLGGLSASATSGVLTAILTYAVYASASVELVANVRDKGLAEARTVALAFQALPALLLVAVGAGLVAVGGVAIRQLARYSAVRDGHGTAVMIAGTTTLGPLLGLAIVTSVAGFGVEAVTLGLLGAGAAGASALAWKAAREEPVEGASPPASPRACLAGGLSDAFAVFNPMLVATLYAGLGLATSIVPWIDVALRDGGVAPPAEARRALWGIAAAWGPVAFFGGAAGLTVGRLGLAALQRRRAAA